MRKSLLGSVLLAAIAGTSVAPVPPITGGQAQIVTRADRAQSPRLPAPTQTRNTMNMIADLSGGPWGPTHPNTFLWLHNRPQPGWRAVQSRRRHNERMRRQRRNAA